MAKAALSVDRAPLEEIRRRRDVCRVCEFSEKKEFCGIVKVRKCGRCSCFIAPKTVIQSEACPIGRWK